MQVTLFLKNKIKRQIFWNGQQFVFIRNVEDDYKQQSEEAKEIVSITGIFHEVTSYIKQTNSDGGQMIGKTQPMILTLCNEDSRLIEKGDKVTVGTDVYYVVEKHNVKGLDVAYDISLEVIV